jgi:hypothetical protein
MTLGAVLIIFGVIVLVAWIAFEAQQHGGKP